MTLTMTASVPPKSTIRIDADCGELGKQTLSLNIEQTPVPATRASH
jgi:hypothetical protein